MRNTSSCSLAKRHFARAASARYVSQPELSEAIHNLEHELQVTLIRREQRFEPLTPEDDNGPPSRSTERTAVWNRLQCGVQGRQRISAEPRPRRTSWVLGAARPRSQAGQSLVYFVLAQDAQMKSKDSISSMSASMIPVSTNGSVAIAFSTSVMLGASTIK